MSAQKFKLFSFSNCPKETVPHQKIANTSKIGISLFFIIQRLGYFRIDNFTDTYQAKVTNS